MANNSPSSLNKPPVIFLMGPTAAGKTAAALSLFDKNPTSLISVDSAMIYRGLDIGSAKPSPQELQRYPHELIDICDFDETYSAAQFINDANRLIATAHAKGKIPLLVGGTMMYFKCLLQGISDLPKSSPEVRARIENIMHEKGLEGLYIELQGVDPSTAERLHPNDKQRIQRALEIFYMTGKPMSAKYSKSYFDEGWDHQAIQSSPYAILPIALAPQEKIFLHNSIELRFEQMIQDGFLDEVQSLMNQPGAHAQLPSMRCVGYKQAWQHLSGETDFHTMKDQMLAATRQLAKRQMTWLRSWSCLNWVDNFDPQSISQIHQLIETHLQASA